MTNTLDLFRDATEGKRRRDAGIARVVSSGSEEWRESARALADRFMATLPLGAEFTGETVRSFLLANTLPEPYHPNVWGATMRSIIGGWRKSGRVTHVGIANAHLASSHARAMLRYRVSSKESP